MRRLTRFAATAMLAVGVLVAASVPAGAQQLVDAGKEGDGSGGLAFVLFAAAVMVFAAALFFMDRIRRRSADEAD